MPVINADGSDPRRGRGPGTRTGAHAVNSLGTTLHMWDRQVAPFTRRFPAGALRPARPRPLRACPRGLYNGASRPRRARGARERPWHHQDQLVRPIHGRPWLGANAPNLHTSSFCRQAAWNHSLKLVREKGIAAFPAPNMERWFTKGFREPSPDSIGFGCRRRLPGMRRSPCAEHGSSRAAAQDQGADADHLPANMTRPLRRKPTSTSKTTSPAQRSPCRAYFQRRATGKPTQCRVGISSRRSRSIVGKELCRARWRSMTDDRSPRRRAP